MDFNNPLQLLTVRGTYKQDHWNAARGTTQENQEYCSKHGEYFSLGDWTRILQKRTREVRPALSSKRILLDLLGSSSEDIKCSRSYLSRKREFDERVVELRQLRLRIS